MRYLQVVDEIRKLVLTHIFATFLKKQKTQISAFNDT